MNLSISAAQLFEQQRDKLGLRWLAGEHIGGSDEMAALDRTGELDAKLGIGT